MDFSVSTTQKLADHNFCQALNPMKKTLSKTVLPTKLKLCCAYMLKQTYKLNAHF